MQRNYRFFYMFISTATILCLYVQIFSWISLVQQKGILKAMSRDVLSVILIVYCFIAFWFVGGLTFFHLYLISTNQVIVTCEFIKFNSCFEMVSCLKLSIYPANKTRIMLNYRINAGSFYVFINVKLKCHLIEFLDQL